MRIGIDGRPLIGNRSGIGRYVYEISRELDRALPEARFFVYSPIPVEMPVLSERWTSRVENLPWARSLKAALWLKLRAGALCRADELDSFIGSAVFLPMLPRSTRTVSVVYDLNFIYAPETMARTTLWSYRFFFRGDVCRAGRVVAISEGTSARLAAYMGRGADIVVHPAASSVFRPLPKEETAPILKSHGISTPYLLAVATWEPRKNLDLLVTTFTRMKEEGLLKDHSLVLVGGYGWRDARLQRLLAGRAAERVLPLGYVADENLPALYSGADALVFPSRYEGFGMPVLEARACGTRVVATDIPEIREAGGDGCVYIQANAEGLRKGILDALAMPRVTGRMEPLPTWKAGAQAIADLLAWR